MTKGLCVDNFKSNPDIYNYLNSITREGYTLKLFGEYIMVSSDSGVGITILNVPKKYLKFLRGDDNVYVSK